MKFATNEIFIGILCIIIGFALGYLFIKPIFGASGKYETSCTWKFSDDEVKKILKSYLEDDFTDCFSESKENKVRIIYEGERDFGRFNIYLIVERTRYRMKKEIK